MQKKGSLGSSSCLTLVRLYLCDFAISLQNLSSLNRIGLGWQYLQVPYMECQIYICSDNSGLMIILLTPPKLQLRLISCSQKVLPFWDISWSALNKQTKQNPYTSVSAWNVTSKFSWSWEQFRFVPPFYMYQSFDERLAISSSHVDIVKDFYMVSPTSCEGFPYCL